MLSLLKRSLSLLPLSPGDTSGCRVSPALPGAERSIFSNADNYASPEQM
jgi:hypothetical protein